MDHSLQISLVSQNGSRLTIFRNCSVRNTAYENAICATAEKQINEDDTHKVFGPWKVVSSKWER